MAEKPDHVFNFAKTKQFDIRPRTVFVEGTTDVDLFRLAARLEREKTGIDLLGDKLAIVAAGENDQGGVNGVCRELISFKNMARYCLLPNGRPKYRFIGLFDDDDAGRRAIHSMHRTDTSIVEYRDVFRLRPVMPLPRNVDTGALKKSFQTENAKYDNLEWELEDLLPETLTSAFLEKHPNAVRCSRSMHGKVHRDWTPDGKARLHRFVRENAIHVDLITVIGSLQALRHYLGIRLPDRT
ncbi:MAG: hypothetical protein JXA89_28635 [Anaerolineae bacterium]|nr:hypothetical protein [Anaerolineae bacterium]